MKLMITLVLATAALAATAATPAQASETDGYEVLCVTPILPGGRPGPEICVPIPV